MGMDNTTRTVKEWAVSSGINPDSARTRATRTLRRTVGQTSVLTPDEWRTVYPDTSAPAVQVKNKSVRKPKPLEVKELPAAPTAKANDWKLPDLATVRRATLDVILIGIVIGHAGLIWYDCADLWDVPGQIGGGLAFFIIVAAVMLSTDPTKNITSQIALFLAAVVDFGAWWVHRPVFESYRVDGLITDVLCGFLCGMSFGALLIYRHQKNN